MAKEVAFLYMDEKYIDTSAPLDMQVISLTGLLVSANTYPQFRDRFFRLLPDFSKGTESLDVEVHASDLFRDRPDEEHFAFYRGLVSIVNELNCRVYRRGCNVPIDHEMHRQNQWIWLHCGFKSILFAVSELGDEFQIWPVMEFDQTSIQDRMFAGYIRMTDHATAYLDMIGEGSSRNWWTKILWLIIPTLVTSTMLAKNRLLAMLLTVLRIFCTVSG